MLPHHKGLPLALFALAAACTDAPPVEATRKETPVQSPVASDPTARYYRSFDPLTLNGIQELDRGSIDYPYVAITRSDNRVIVSGELIDSSVDADCRFSMFYERRVDIFSSREVYGPLEHGFDYTEKDCYIHAGEEHCYFYLLRKYESTHLEDVRIALLSYTRENRQEKTEFLFSVWGDDERSFEKRSNSRPKTHFRSSSDGRPRSCEPSVILATKRARSRLR